MNKLINYIKGTQAELKHVNWPTKKQTIDFTLLVIVVTIGIAVFLGFFDVSFGFLLSKFII